jgi:type I site-specific restriction-modification system R (restriction) subunit
LEKIDNEGVTGFHKQLIAQFGGKCAISEESLARYDLNIVSHMRKINDNRDEPMVLKYFQYLSLLFVEYYLDQYFNNREALIDGLNTYLADFNAQFPNDTYEQYTAKDLNKIAIWNATGSGKTLIMHINYLQYLHYSGEKLPDDATFILLTPKEGLSLQHIEDYAASGIPARVYDKSVSRWMQNANEIIVLENTKLGDKDQDTIVSVKRFGNRNVVFVDEGHRGSSSGKEGKWQKYRDELCFNGFSFEYSATFGQAIAASSDKSLAERYGKCIIFDYSYKHFYGDGYGKDYNIINLPDDSDEIKRNTYLTACLMTYYQQKRLFLIARHNVNITRQDLRDLLQNNQWYKLLIPEDELVVRSFEDYKRFERIAVALLTKYFDRFYYAKQNRWESQVVGYDLVPMDDKNENFLNEEKDEYSISIDDTSENETAISWLRQVIVEVEKAKKEKRLPSFAIPRQGDMEAISVPTHLYNPLQIGYLP